jgi:hypothetical protein
MRAPRGKRSALRALADDAEGEIVRHPNRKAIPADPWDDLIVSYFRGQPWHRAWKDWFRAPLGTPMPD